MAGFDSLSLSASLEEAVHALGYGAPTAIQAEAIPLLLAGRDLVGQSQTGSGKTAAFALPILQRLSLQTRQLQALIVCPTRELAAQVAREIRRLGRGEPDLQIIVVAGGEPSRPQRDALERGVHVVVGTPGRLLDHLQSGALPTQSVATVVLDEADRMLDMGFQRDMEAILAALPASRQTVFFSATFPDSIEAMSRAHQKDPARIAVGESDTQKPEIRQLSVLAEPAERLERLFRVFQAFPVGSALVFCNFKATVAKLARDLSAAGLSVACLHGDLDQFERDQVLARFRNQSVRVLIATDVAGRGIDVAELELVVNYELSPQAEVYVHRIGRTGRAGQPGVAVAFVGRSDGARVEAIEALTGQPMTVAELPAGPAPEPSELAVAKRPKMQTILLSGGRKDKVRPGDVLGALTNEDAGLDGADIGKIELHDRLTYVAVERSVARRAVDSLNRGKVKGRRFRASLANVSGYQLP